MNGQSADRQTSKELKETIEGIASHRRHTLSFINNPDRHLEITRDRIASLKGSLAAAEKQLADYESLLRDPAPYIDALDESIAKKSQTLLVIRNKERLQQVYQLNKEIAELQAGDPEAVTEDMIVS